MLRTRLASTAAALALAACGGGVWIGTEIGFDDTPPSVSLAVDRTSAAAGQALRLVAAAADDSGIDSVEFFRLDAGVRVSLARSGAPPWEWISAAPADGRSDVRYVARATDGEGNRADSNVVIVTITVTP